MATLSNCKSSEEGEEGKERMKRICINIPQAINEDGVTFYCISMTSGKVSWSFRRRYKDFFEVHETLVGLDFTEKETLPPKKFLGSKDPAFILKRRRDLESYIRSLLEKEAKASLPQCLVDFLELSLYDVDYILTDLAASKAFFEIQPDFIERWNPLQLHAISHRLKTPRPSIDLGSTKYDFAHLVDYTRHLSNLHVKGSNDPHGASNIIPNTLIIDFVAFKSLVYLRLEKIDVKCLESLGTIKDTLVELAVNHCPSLSSIGKILLCDAFVEERNEDILRREHLKWKNLKKLDLRYNAISEIDLSLMTAPGITTLNLGHNHLSTVENLTCLPHLDILDLSFNNIKSVTDLHAKLGQTREINLSGNQITDLDGFSRLFSLMRLSICDNKLRELEAIFCISSLPCLEFINLQGNSVTSVVDYRLKVLESFGKRCPEITLDTELASQQEIDKVSVLMALRVAREGKSPTSLFGNLPRKV